MKKNFSPNHKLQLLIIFAFAFLIYANTLGFQFALDDNGMILDNKYTHLGVKGFGKLLLSDSFEGSGWSSRNILPGGRYRPFSLLFFALVWQIFGATAFIYHFFNIIFYGALCVLIFITLKKILSQYNNSPKWFLQLPFVATLLYAANPLHVEAVANIKGMDEVLSTIGVISALYFSVLYVEKQKLINLLYIFLCMLVALFSKEQGITFVVIIPLALYYFTSAKIRNYVFIMLPLIAASAIFIYTRYLALGYLFNSTVIPELMNNPFLDCSLPERYATIMFTLLKYLQLLFFPIVLTHDYYPLQIPIIGWTDHRALLSMAVYLFMFSYSIFYFRKKTIISFSILFYLITLSITSNIFFVIGTFMNERFMFMPSLGFSIFLAYIIIFSFKKIIEDKSSYLSSVKYFILFILFAFSLRTVSRNFAWKNDFTLATTDVQISTNSARCHAYAGSQYFGFAVNNAGLDSISKLKYIDLSVNHLKRSLQLHIKNMLPWYISGEVNAYLGKYSEALLCYENTLEMNEGNPEVLVKVKNISVLANNRDMPDIAAEAERITKRFSSDSIVNMYDAAILFEHDNNIDTAFYILHKIIELNPDYALAYSELGHLYGSWRNDLPTSIKYLEKAIALDPENGTTYENLGVAYGTIGNIPLAVKNLEKAVKYKPNDNMTLQTLAFAYTKNGQFEEAIASLTTAIERDPNNPELHFDIAECYNKTNNLRKANEHSMKGKILEDK